MALNTWRKYLKDMAWNKMILVTEISHLEITVDSWFSLCQVELSSSLFLLLTLLNKLTFFGPWFLGMLSANSWPIHALVCRSTFLSSTRWLFIQASSLGSVSFSMLISLLNGSEQGYITCPLNLTSFGRQRKDLSAGGCSSSLRPGLNILDTPNQIFKE